MEHISKCLRTLMKEGLKARGEEPCVICGIRKADGVDSFPVCTICRPDLERDYDAEIDRQIKAEQEKMAEEIAEAEGNRARSTTYPDNL